MDLGPKLLPKVVPAVILGMGCRNRIMRSVAGADLSRLATYGVVALVLLDCAGCDRRPTRVPVAGVVLIDGQPLNRGNIEFVPEHGRPSSGKIAQDGHFTLTCYDGNDGALVGRHRVQVAASRIISDGKIEWFAPPNYADFRTSNINVEITKPIDDLKIELSWGGRKGPFVQSR
jgi:hypothetical protein